MSANPGKKVQTSTSTIFYQTGKATAVIDKDLNLLYQVEFPFMYGEKEFNYDVANVLTDDGSWYYFGIQYTGKGDEKTGEYGYFETTPDGKTSEFKKVGFDKNYISEVYTEIVGDKLIQYGLWSKTFNLKTMSGTFYLEMDIKAQVKINVQQFTEFTTEELSQFIYNLNKSKVEKNGSISGIVPIVLEGDSGKFENGNYVSVFKRAERTFLQGYDISIGSILVAQYGPKSTDMINTIVLINQQTPGQINFFSIGATLIDDKVVVLFNDHQSNANITTTGEPKLYDPVPLKTSTTASYAVIINSTGEAKRFKLASLSEENIIFKKLSPLKSENGIVVMMKEDPKVIEKNYNVSGDDELKSYLLEIQD